ncbi:MAG: DNA translocase FtsK, partial [Lachnospiraceae bacterium]|nr:DNA translocase FtsK [Lachnospiraceae bacterium]
MVGTILIVLLCSVVSFILLTERSFIDSMRDGKERIRELSVGDPERRLEDAERREEAREAAARRREEANQRREEATKRRREEAESRREAAESRRDAARQRKEEQEKLRAEREAERRLREEELENEKILRMEKKVTGVTADTALKPEESIRKGDIHEITYQGDAAELDRKVIRTAHAVNFVEDQAENVAESVSKPVIQQAQQHELPHRSEHQIREIRDPQEGQGSYKEPHESFEAHEVHEIQEPRGTMLTHEAEQIRVHKDGVEDRRADGPAGAAGYAKPEAIAPAPDTMSPVEKQMQKDMQSAEKKAPKKYMFPPLSRLQKGETGKGDSAEELKETAMRLQQTLNTFGVKVTITEISQGPSVTRYELQPEQGVKVSKIVGLTDDIKLNLAATDIRIEAPIPGKAAIGIEVPNKENMMVSLRDLLESKEFKEFPSNIAFAVGKDIAGKTVVADIAKMPHMLIAGSTGSGKSVCINTLIMSILYKAHPSDVKLIMVDPKVVELSVYNGIPHLLIPVVTDPKKASAALHWAVSEMEDRYRKFADYNVRDLKGYNQKLETLRENGEEDVPGKLPQIVSIVDELADLMMVCP